MEKHGKKRMRMKAVETSVLLVEKQRNVKTMCLACLDLRKAFNLLTLEVMCYIDMPFLNIASLMFAFSMST